MLRNVGVNRHHENPTVLVDTNSLRARDRKSTRLNSSHDQISYAVFCLKKKKKSPLSKLNWTWSHQNSRHPIGQHDRALRRTNLITGAIPPTKRSRICSKTSASFASHLY